MNNGLWFLLAVLQLFMICSPLSSLLTIEVVMMFIFFSLSSSIDRIVPMLVSGWSHVKGSLASFLRLNLEMTFCIL